MAAEDYFDALWHGPRLLDNGGEKLNARHRRFGARCDLASATGAAMTAASDVLTTTGGEGFETEDIGKLVAVPGAGAAGANLVSSIIGINGANEVVLADAAATTVSGQTTVFGTDDTLAIQDLIDDARTARKRGYVPGAAIITDTLLFGTGYGWSFTCDPLLDFLAAPNSGLIWAGPAGQAMVEINEQNGSDIGFLSLNNRTAFRAADVTGVLWRNTSGDITAGQHNTYRKFGIYGCRWGIRIGNYGGVTGETGTVYAGDGYDSNIEDNVIEFLHMFDTDNPILLDSEDIDLWQIKHFRSGGHPSGRTRDFLIRLLRAGNGFRIEETFARVDHITDDAAAIDIQDGAFSCVQCSLEGPANIRAIDVGTNVISRDQIHIQKLLQSNGMRDSLGRAADLGGKSGILLEGCSFTGHVDVRRPVVAIGTVFETGYGIRKVAGSLGEIVELGTSTRTSSAFAITTEDSGTKVGRYSGSKSVSVTSANLLSGTAYTLATVDLPDSSSFTLIVHFNLWRTTGSVRNLSAGGSIIYNAHADNAGNIVVGTPDIRVVTSRGSEYTSFTVTASAVADAGADTVACRITQTNLVTADGTADPTRIAYRVELLGTVATEDADVNLDRVTL